MNYLDFDLLIEKNATGYRAKVINSPAGQASQAFSLPFSALELENFVLRLGHLRQGMRRIESPGMEAAKEFGGKLFNALFTDDVKSCWQSSLNDAARNHAGLRLRLRLSDAPELLDVPWEFLYHASLNRFLVLSVETPLVRYLDLSGHIAPLTIRFPLRVLVMIASPRDYPTLDVAREWQRLKAAVAGLEQRGLLVLERLPLSTLGALQRQLRQNDYHIFHFIGHGGYDQQAQDGVLLLEDESGNSRPISGQYLGMILHDETTLRLALLNCCEGGRTSATDPFAGVCQSLVQQGIPAVIAMQFAISDRAAITLTHEFYTALAEGLPVDTALAEARKGIFAENNDVEWGTPVLYMRMPNGQIFDVASSPTTATVTERRPTVRPQQTGWQRSVALFTVLALLAVIVSLGLLFRGSNPQKGTVIASGALATTLPATATGVMPTNTNRPTLAPTPTTSTLMVATQNESSTPEATPIPTETALPTATQSPLPTNSITLPPTPTPTPIGHVYSFDNAADDGWDLDADWKIVPLDSGGGALQVTAPQDRWPATSLRDKQAMPPDIALQGRVRILQPTNGAAGDTDLKLSIRANNNDPSGFEAYSVYISSHLQNTLLRRDSLAGYDAGVVLGEAKFVWALNRWYTLRIEARGSRISVSIDGQERIAVKDEVLTKGFFYLTASPGAQIQFDEISVEP
jgi:hypothetical protein